MSAYAGSPPSPSRHGRMATRAAVALLVSGALALAWWGYRSPDLFLELVRLPLC